jgi:Domain of unknown function (DUF4136)
MKASHLLPTLSALINLRRHFNLGFKPLPESKSHLKAIFLIAISIFSALSGCAGLRTVDSDVTAFSTLDAAPLGATYRFERLPSQQTDSLRQDLIETYAQAALDKQGFQRVGDAPGSAKAAYTVQMQHNVQRFDSAPWDERGPRFSGYIVIGHGAGWGYPFGMLPLAPYPYPSYTQPYYVREVSLVLRDVVNATVVYETKARHEGRWADDLAVLPLMFEAALQGFPKPPAGVQRISLKLGQAQ